MSKLKRVSILGFICLALPAFALVLRSELDAAAACRSARLNELDGQVHEAMYQYARCAEWNTLITGESDSAGAALIRLARAAESRGDLTKALIAWRYLRGAWLTTDHVFRIDTQPLSQANEQIARLTAQLQFHSGSPTVADRSIEQLRHDHLSLLNRRNGPGPLGGGIIFVLFLAWIGSVVWTIWSGVTKDGRFNKGTSVRGGLMIAFSFTLFCFCLNYF